MTEAEGRKPRSPSAFILFKVVRPEPGKPLKPVEYTALATKPTNKELVDIAMEQGDGEYEIHYVRRRFNVVTRTETYVE